MGRNDEGAGRRRHPFSGEGPSPGSHGPRKLGDLVGDFLDRHGLEAEVERQGVVEDWAEVVGSRIAEVTEPRSVSKGVLFVAVRSSAWLMELNMMKHEILQRLNEGRAPDRRVERIVFVQRGESGSPPSGGTSGHEDGGPRGGSGRGY